MEIQKNIYLSIKNILQEDKQNILYLFYYSTIEAILLLVIPLASSFIINSILAHATISIAVLGVVLIVVFILITLLQIIKHHIIEKFEQKIFLNTGIEIAKMAIKIRKVTNDKIRFIDKYMNYFFDITSIQKIFPMVLLDGTALVVKLIVSLLLLLAFDVSFFILGVILFFLFIILLYFLGKGGVKYAIERSHAKHNAIYYLQSIPDLKIDADIILGEYDEYLKKFIYARRKIFDVVIRQLSLTFVMEGLVFSSFLIFGGYLVVHGSIPLGEFVAAEIVVVSLIYALRGFMKNIDSIYDMAEGFYKIDSLSRSLKENSNV